MEQDILVYVGLDVHKDTIAISVADTGRAAGRFLGTIAHDVGKLWRAIYDDGDRPPLSRVGDHDV